MTTMLFTTGRLPLPRKGSPEPRRSFIWGKHYIHAIDAKVWSPSTWWSTHIAGGVAEEAYEIRLHSSISLNRVGTTIDRYGGTSIVLNQRDVRNLMKALKACMPSDPEAPMLVELTDD